MRSVILLCSLGVYRFGWVGTLSGCILRRIVFAGFVLLYCLLLIVWFICFVVIGFSYLLYLHRRVVFLFVNLVWLLCGFNGLYYYALLQGMSSEVCSYFGSGVVVWFILCICGFGVKRELLATVSLSLV